MAKELSFDQTASESLRAGVEKLARAVKVTLGPRGRAAVLDKGWGSPKVSKDGATVADEIELANHFENMGAQLVKQAASKTNDDAGDGTTTATVLAEAIYREGLKNVIAGADAMSLCRGIQAAASAVVKEIDSLSRPVKDSEVLKVAAIAANNDPAIGRMVADALDKVGADGVVTVEEGKGLETEVNVVEGMQFDRGFSSPHFVTNPDTMEVELENPYILVHEDKISSAKDLVPLLETISKAARPLLIIAEEVEGEALATLVVNKLRGVVQCAAVKAPGYGDRRKAMLEDIATLTGARAVFKDLGIKLENIQLSDLGTAKKITLDTDKTTIIEGAGETEALEGRIAQIRKLIETTTSDYDREKLEERLAKLAGGVAQINAGAATETEMKEIKSRVEDALNATRAAIEQGVVPGGGVALLRAATVVDKLRLKREEKLGAKIVGRALAAPLWQIGENAGAEGPVVVRKVAKGEGAYGYDAAAGKYCDLVRAGVIDPAKVVKAAVQNAASVACMLLTAGALVADRPEKTPEPPAGGPGPGMPPGGMPGMGGGMPGMGGGMPGMGGGMPGMM